MAKWSKKIHYAEYAMKKNMSDPTTDFGADGEKPPGGFDPNLESKWQKMESFKPKAPVAETLDDRIKFAQSWNLAVALIAPSNSKGIAPDKEIEEALEYWQPYFHKKLINK